MELYSKEELLKELKKEYSCGGECDHCPEVLDAGSCSVLRCIRRIIDNAQPVEAIPKGEWIYKEFDVESGISHSYWCSNCGKPKSQWCDDFCQRCGADMRKGGAV